MELYLILTPRSFFVAYSALFWPFFIFLFSVFNRQNYLICLILNSTRAFRLLAAVTYFCIILYLLKKIWFCFMKIYYFDLILFFNLFLIRHRRYLFNYLYWSLLTFKTIWSLISFCYRIFIIVIIFLSIFHTAIIFLFFLHH